MVPKRSGSIINISSIFANSTVKQCVIPAYYASKGAVASLTQSLAVELGPHNVRVNAIARLLPDRDFGRDVRFG